MGGSPIADGPKIAKTTPSEACELARTPTPTTPHTPPLRPMGTVGRRASPSALPSPHTLIQPAPVLPPASLPPAPPMPLRGMEAHVFAACSRCAASLAPLATLGSSDAVGAAESGLCFEVRLRPAIRSPGGGAGAFTDSSKVRSRHTSLNSHACILWGCYTHSHACCRSPTHSMAICVCSQELQGRFAKANIEYVILQGFLLPSFEACARVRTRFL